MCTPSVMPLYLILRCESDIVRIRHCANQTSRESDIARIRHHAIHTILVMCCIPCIECSILLYSVFCSILCFLDSYRISCQARAQASTTAAEVCGSLPLGFLLSLPSMRSLHCLASPRLVPVLFTVTNSLHPHLCIHPPPPEPCSDP